jgi:cytochrome c553
MFNCSGFFYAIASKFDIKKTFVGMTLPLMLIGASMPACAAAPSASSGKNISGMCAACHGSNGMAVTTLYPNLAGQNYQYLLQQLKAFKGGQRNNSIMHSMTVDLSKQQMQDLAAYFASLQRKDCTTDKSKP